MQRQFTYVLDERREARIALASMCAGQGRDVLEVLATHRRGRDVRARLVELDPRNIQYAEAYAREHALGNVEILARDAGNSDAYVGIAPAHVVVACGVFGNLGQGDIARTIEWLPALCAPGAHVIWTRHRRTPDRTPWIRHLFGAAGFEEIDFVAPDDRVFTVGTCQLAREPDAFVGGHQLFNFVGDGEQPA